MRCFLVCVLTVVTVVPAFMACSDRTGTPEVFVSRVKDRSQLPGGLTQYGDEGDYLLENSKIRAVVLDAGHQVSPALWGGALVDLDLVRPHAPFRGGKGLEQFFMVHPMVNLNVPNPRDNGGMTMWASPDGKLGVVRMIGQGDRVLGVLNLMDKVKELPAMVEEKLHMSLDQLQKLLETLYDVHFDIKEAMNIPLRVATLTDYSLSADADYLEITTVFRALSSEECANGADDDGDGKSDCKDPDCSLDPACPEWCSSVNCPEGMRCHPFWGGCFPECTLDAGCDMPSSSDSGECAPKCPAGSECDLVSNLCVPKAREMKALAKGTNLLDVLSGGLLSIIGELDVKDMASLLSRLPELLAQIVEKPGFVAGDMALLGANAPMFVPGIGYEVDTQYRLMFLRGQNVLLSPLSFNAMIGTADRVSYGYFTLDGEILLPFSTESLTASMSHGANCLHSDEDDAVCDNVPFLRYKRYVAVGEGDAASVYEVIYKLRNTPHGRVTGHVLDGKTFKPVSRASVFAIADPCDPKICTQLPPGCGAPFATYEELAKAARVCSSTPELPDGIGMVVSQFETDRGTDPFPDGSFEGPLEPGVYYLVARRSSGAPVSVPARVEVRADETVEVALVLPVEGKLAFRVLDQEGELSPARVTIGHCFPECSTSSDCPDSQVCDSEFQCRPKNGCKEDSDCDEDEECVGGKCRCKLSHLPGDPFEELGDGYLADRKVAMVLAPTGEGEVLLPPGKYDVVFSRGFEYTIDRKKVEIIPGKSVFVDALVNRVVDTTGWLSIDEHVHGTGSPDSAVTNKVRLESCISDGLELVVMTDHDYIQRLEPQIRELGLWQRIAAWPGEEISTLDTSHIVAWPLDYKQFESAHGALEWQGVPPEAIFAWARSHGALPGPDALVIIPHPRGGMTSYFDLYGLSPYTLELEQGEIQAVTPLLAPEYFSPAFDMMEVANSKRFDIFRIPTMREVLDYNVILRRALKGQEKRTRREIMSELFPASANVVRAMLARSKEEHEGIWGFSGTPGCHLCREPSDCPEGLACRIEENDEGLGLCMAKCDESGACSGSLPCIDGWCGDPAVLPCDAIKGMTDDWLRLLYHGVFKPAVGSSDTHGVANSEMGCLRTYVRSPAENPVAVSVVQLADSLRHGHSFVTYGPFVDFTIEGKGPGETVQLPAGKQALLRIRVQSPPWFDVSRVELLRNGVLEEVFDSNSSDPAHRIIVPNEQVVNLDVTLKVSPPEDSWYVVLAMGVNGRPMAPVYGSLELPPVYLGDLFSSVLGSLPISLPTYMVFPKIPVYYPHFPVAITNPIFVDVDGKDAQGCEFTAPGGPPPSWACNYPPDYPPDRISCICREVTRP